MSGRGHRPGPGRSPGRRRARRRGGPFPQDRIVRVGGQHGPVEQARHELALGVDGDQRGLRVVAVEAERLREQGPRRLRLEPHLEGQPAGEARWPGGVQRAGELEGRLDGPAGHDRRVWDLREDDAAAPGGVHGDPERGGRRRVPLAVGGGIGDRVGHQALQADVEVRGQRRADRQGLAQRGRRRRLPPAKTSRRDWAWRGIAPGHAGSRRAGGAAAWRPGSARRGTGPSGVTSRRGVRPRPDRRAATRGAGRPAAIAGRRLCTGSVARAGGRARPPRRSRARAAR